MRFNGIMSCLFFGVILIFSCSPKLGTNISNSGVFYPPMQDTARVQFLTSIKSSNDVRKSSKFEEALVGKRMPININKAFGISAGKGNIYVSDIGSSSVDIVNFNNGTFDSFRPNKKYELIIHTAVDEAGNFYLLDSKIRKVFVYDINKEFVAEFDIPEAINPFDIAVKKNKIWITDVKNNRVYVLNASDYSLVDHLPKEKGEVGDESYLYQPYSIAASDEYVVVVDMGAFNVKLFSYEGEFIRNIGSFGRASGQFSRPKGIAIDKEGFIYVVDHAFQNIQIFNTEGQLLMFFGFPLGQFTGLNLPADIAIDYDNIEYFKPFVDPKYELQYLVYVTSQFGDNKVSVFGRIEPMETKE